MGSSSKRTTVALLAFGVLVLHADALASTVPTARSDATLNPTKTVLVCTPSSVIVGKTANCTATVTDTATPAKARKTPTGVAAFTSTGTGAFSAASCTLAGTGAAAKCLVAYTAGSIGKGVHALTASYAGDALHTGSAAQFKLDVQPVNDEPSGAQRISSLPTSVEGATFGATSGEQDPEPSCGEVDQTVWYRLGRAPKARLGVLLRARGSLDAVLAVYRRVRSQIKEVACAPTDERGVAGISFRSSKGSRYLLLVGQRPESQPGSFSFRLFIPPSARPPGALLRPVGVRSSLDALQRPEEAWSVQMAAGTTYRLNLVASSKRCLSLSLFAPGSRSFVSEEPVRELECGGYMVFTPGPDGGGRYSLLVQTSGGRTGAQPYHLLTARAGLDDTAPGLPLANGKTRSGSLTARGIDIVDLYRFQVSKRSDVSLRLSDRRTAAFDLLLLREDGSRVLCECFQRGSVHLRTELDGGRYFVAVRARAQSGGPYRLAILVREITQTKALISGLIAATSTPGQAVTLTTQVSPAVASGGLVRLQLDRFDPLEGWQFFRLFRVRLGANGAAAVMWKPPTVGRWRLHAAFLGTRAASPSESGYARLLVAAPR